ncbi:hypothetical protein ACGFIK_21710 [Micromonospora sp. NPDC048871]|uniref:hypothetical protein n=1 Tax=Micromonospora sp. NPDC048871 TaxID=3364259 RepID=UPI003720CBBD
MTAHRSEAPDTATNTIDHFAPHRDNSAHAVADGGGRSTRPASTTGEGAAPESGPHTTPTRRGTTDVATRDSVDADLAAAVRRTALMRQTFYVLVLLVALVGQVTGSVHTLDIPPLIAIPAVAALELGGVVVMANADVRRRLGEHALASRLLSAVIAAAAVTFNWIAHPDHLVGGFYAAMSALGYLVWLMHTGNQRRDRLRATGNLPPTPPAYELIGHWIRHPSITIRARSLAKADGLDLYDSLQAARTAITREHRHQAIATVLRRKIRKAVDPATADIAIHLYDLDEIAQRLTASADYAGLTTLLAADLTPETIIAAGQGGRPRRRWRKRENAPVTPTAPAPTPAQPPVLSPSTPATSNAADHMPNLNREPQPAPSSNDDASPPIAAPSTRPTGTGMADTHDSEESVGETRWGNGKAITPTSTAESVAYWLRVEPDLTPEMLAERIGKSLRSVYRYLPADYPRRPGIPRKRIRQRQGSTRGTRQDD